MKDWRAIAKAAGVEATGKELDGIMEPLAALEEAFRPLVRDLPPELEPATSFLMEEDETG